MLQGVEAITVQRRSLGRLIGSERLVLFMNGSGERPRSAYSARALEVLNSLGAPFRTVDASPDSELRAELRALTNWPTLPQLFVDGEFVGGSDLLIELQSTGELDRMLERSGVPRPARPRTSRAPRNAAHRSPDFDQDGAPPVPPEVRGENALRKHDCGISGLLVSEGASVGESAVLSVSWDGTLRWWDLALNPATHHPRACPAPTIALLRDGDGTLVSLDIGGALCGVPSAAPPAGQASDEDSVALVPGARRGVGGGLAGDSGRAHGGRVPPRLLLDLAGVAPPPVPVTSVRGHPSTLAWRTLYAGCVDGTIYRLRVGERGWTRWARTHEAAVRCLALSPDGAVVVSGGADYDAHVLDTSGALVVRLRGHSSWVNDVALVPARRIVVTASCDRSVRCWELPSGRCLARLTGPAAPVDVVSVTPLSDQVFGGASDGTLWCWALDAVLAASAGFGCAATHTDSIWSVAFSERADYIAAASADRAVSCTDAATGRVQLVSRHEGWANAVALSRDGQHIVSGGADCRIKVWGRRTGRCVAEWVGHTGWVNGVALGKYESLIVSASADRTVRCWEARSGAPRWVSAPHGGPVWSVALVETRRQVLSAAADGVVRILCLDTGALVREHRAHAGGASSVAADGTGEVATSVGADGDVCVWDLRGGGLAHRLACHQDRAWMTSVDSEGGRAVSAAGDGRLCLIHTRLGRVADVWCGAEPLTACAISTDGRRVVAGTKAGTLLHFSVVDDRLRLTQISGE